MNPLVDEGALFGITPEQGSIGSQSRNYMTRSALVRPQVQTRTIVSNRGAFEQLEAILGLECWDLPKRKLGQEVWLFVRFIVLVFSREIERDTAKGGGRQDLHTSRCQ